MGACRAVWADVINSRSFHARHTNGEGLRRWKYSRSAAGARDAMVSQAYSGVVAEEAPQRRVSGCQPVGMAPHRIPRADAEARRLQGW